MKNYTSTYGQSSMPNEKHLRTVVKAIEQIKRENGSFNPCEALSAFVQHATVSVIEANKKIGSPVFKTLASYRQLGFKTINPGVRMPNQDQIMAAVTAYMNAVREHEAFTDLLSPIFAQFLGKGGQGLGQFFTPWDIAKVTSAIAIDHQKRHGIPAINRVHEPCCGAGGLILAVIQDHIAGSADEPLRAALSLDVSANDIDPLCAAMTALQISASQFVHGIALGQVEITVGNCLVGKCSVVYQSLPTDPERIGLLSDVLAMESAVQRRAALEEAVEETT
jgi:hypothetical protein